MKSFYEQHHDQIASKRFDSKFPIRRRVHREIYASVTQWVSPGLRVLDAGCGEGVLSCLLAQNGANVTAIDYSRPNIEAAIRRAKELGGACASISFERGDAEHLPYAENAFDCVVSNHVLEHLPDFERGIAELHRVTRDLAIVALPTCVNPAAWALLGGDRYWRLGRRTPFAVPLGAARVGVALLLGKDGVDEGYAGRSDNTHIFRFPWKAQAALERAGFEVLEAQAQSIPMPYVPISLSALRRQPVFRNLGVGTVFRLRKRR